MEQQKNPSDWMKKMGIITGALLMGLGGFMIWKNDPMFKRQYAILMTIYGAFRMGMAIYQMKKTPSDNTPPSDETTPTN